MRPSTPISATTARIQPDKLKLEFGDQGVPLGLIAAIPLILQAKEITYAKQAVFSFAYWLFSMNLLWALIVDSIYFRRIGRRKSWMVCVGQTRI
uniref:Uncharacterized protein n=1 Tax=Globodera rostochiensis TaxID=31243 RepID=A0A914GXU7_GLORO